MTAEDVRRIVLSVEKKTGWTFCLEDVYRVLRYTERKAKLNGKGTDYVPILFENELRDFVMREVINFMGRENECAASAT